MCGRQIIKVDVIPNCGAIWRVIIGTEDRSRRSASSPSSAPMAPNDRWWLDFGSDQLTCGRRFPILTVDDLGDRTYFETVRQGLPFGKRFAVFF
jgi:hypothetical protein